MYLKRNLHSTIVCNVVRKRVATINLHHKIETGSYSCYWSVPRILQFMHERNMGSLLLHTVFKCGVPTLSDHLYWPDTGTQTYLVSIQSITWVLIHKTLLSFIKLFNRMLSPPVTIGPILIIGSSWKFIPIFRGVMPSLLSYILKLFIQSPCIIIICTTCLYCQSRGSTRVQWLLPTLQTWNSYNE